MPGQNILIASVLIFLVGVGVLVWINSKAGPGGLGGEKRPRNTETQYMATQQLQMNETPKPSQYPSKTPEPPTETPILTATVDLQSTVNVLNMTGTAERGTATGIYVETQNAVNAAINKAEIEAAELIPTMTANIIAETQGAMTEQAEARQTDNALEDAATQAAIDGYRYEQAEKVIRQEKITGVLEAGLGLFCFGIVVILLAVGAVFAWEVIKVIRDTYVETPNLAGDNYEQPAHIANVSASPTNNVRVSITRGTSTIRAPWPIDKGILTDFSRAVIQDESLGVNEWTGSNGPFIRRNPDKPASEQPGFKYFENWMEWLINKAELLERPGGAKNQKPIPTDLGMEVFKKYASGRF